jgi:hypothetical protein
MTAEVEHTLHHPGDPGIPRWLEVTTFAELASGRRTFLPGQPEVPRTKYIVVRLAPELRHEWSELHGRWYERDVPMFGTKAPPGSWTGKATGVFEAGEDGEMAEVFEVRTI